MNLSEGNNPKWNQSSQKTSKITVFALDVLSWKFRVNLDKKNKSCYGRFKCGFIDHNRKA